MARFMYYNANPNGFEENDCVIRAISLATDVPYQEIEHKLLITADLLDCDALCVCCYEYLITSIYNGKNTQCYGLTVEDFADEHPFGTYLVRIDGHLTTIVDNCICDIWDCRDEMFDIAWEIS